MQKHNPLSLHNTHVKLLAFDLLSLTPSSSSEQPFPTFYRRGIPISRAEIVGTVTLRDLKPAKFLRFAIDDGTGCIPCILWLNHLTSPHLARRRSPDDLRLLADAASRSSAIVKIGAVARVRGRITVFKGAVQITVSDVVLERDPNAEYWWHRALALIFGKMSEVKTKVDFIQWLGPDMSIKVLTHLDDPGDLVRVSAVSSSWYRFVIENGLCKQLCLRMFPEIYGVVHNIKVDNMIEPVSNVHGSGINWECLKRNHKIYALLAFGLTPIRNNCISKAISASSTDNYPEESILNTLEPRDRTENTASYWSSEGENDPSAPETLMYVLCSKVCLVMEIHVQPFQAYFQYGFPIYSAKAVRFRMGHPRYQMELESAIADNMPARHIVGDNQFIWTYTSPVFPMSQKNQLQKFKLPEPVLCIGGVLLVELLGRVQKQEMDGLFYICISHVQVVGRPLSPAIDVKIHHPSGKCTLKYCPQTDSGMSSASSSRGDSSSPSRLRSLTSSIMQRGARRWEQIVMGALLGSGAALVDD